MRISDWSSDVCSSDLRSERHSRVGRSRAAGEPRRSSYGAPKQRLAGLEPPFNSLNEAPQICCWGLFRARRNPGDISKWDSPERGKEAMDALVWRLKETDPEAFTEVQSAERVQQIADGFAMKQDELWGSLTLTPENAENLPGSIGAGQKGKNDR